MDSADEPSLFATPTSADSADDPVAEPSLEQTAQPEPEPQPRSQTPPREVRAMTPEQQRSEVQAVRREAEALHDTARQIEKQLVRAASPSDAGAAAPPRPPRRRPSRRPRRRRIEGERAGVGGEGRPGRAYIED